jgi:sugar lactone lactonase YvrE
LSDPADVVFLPDGRLLVSDFTAFGGGGGLIFVDPDSGRQQKAVAATEFSRPAGIAVGASGHVVVAYMQRPHGRGDVCDVDLATGEHRLPVPDTTLFEPYGVAIDGAGDIVVGEPDESGEHSKVHRLLRSGIQHVLHDGPPGLIYAGVAVEAGGSIVVATSAVHDPGRVTRFDTTGQSMQTLTVGENLVFPVGIALDHAGAILLADTSRKIVRVDPGSGAQTVVASGGSLSSPVGLAVAR